MKKKKKREAMSFVLGVKVSRAVDKQQNYWGKTGFRERVLGKKSEIRGREKEKVILSSAEKHGDLQVYVFGKQLH